MEDKKIPKDTLVNSRILIDCSALKDMFNGEEGNKSKELLKLMKDLNDGGKRLDVFTTSASFQRAIFLSNPDVKIQNIQKVLTFLEVAPSLADFKNEKAVTDEIIRFVKVMSRGSQDNTNEK